MKLCMLSDYSGIMDEGMRNTAFYLERGLSRHHEILHLSLKPYRRLLSPRFWGEMRAFRPDIIHFIPGPTIKSFILVKALKMNCPKAKTVMSATLPSLSPFSRRLVPWLRPSLILTQSPESEAMFTCLGCRTRFLPGGVDTVKFAPVSEETKHELRRKYQLEAHKWIVLHVGPIKGGRNLLLLSQMQQEEDTQVLIIGSLSVPMEREVYQSLEEKGCLVWRSYFDDIAEIYALSDCYVFPTIDRSNSIELPLSVLEAMSCNLPVLSTPFGALPHLFAPGEGLSFAEKEGDLIQLLRQVKEGSMKPRTREKVLSYSWEDIVERLEQIYHEVAG